MKYKLVIFDFDGTLADSFPWFTKALNKAANKFHFHHCEENETEHLRSLDIKSIMKKLKIPFWKAPMIVAYMRSNMTTEIASMRLFEGVSNLLERLADKELILALVTTNSHENVIKVLGERNASLFTHYECGVDVFGKGHKFKKILAKTHLSAKEAICIGDEIRDIEAAKQARIDSGAVSWGYTTFETLKKYSPTKLFTTIEEIYEKVFF
jgi:phosphoglycolate phosphatase